MTHRLLAIDGGGLRGIIAVAFLERIEALASARAGRAVRLCEVFDLVGGTSTGSIIATAIALGRPMGEIREDYLSRGAKIFRPTWDIRRKFGVSARYDAKLLEAEIEKDVGTRTLDSPDLKTRLAVVAKRMDTGAPWILSNIPTAPYFNDPQDGSYLGNRHYRLSKIILASAAAPSLFDPLLMQVAPDQPRALFVDGAITPWNDPSIPVLMLARMRAYGLEWPTGPSALKLVSVGTGTNRETIAATRAVKDLSIAFAAKSLLTLIGDAANQTHMLMRWLGRPILPEAMNSEIGDLGEETLGPEPLFGYLRLNVPLEAGGLAAQGIAVTEAQVQKLRALDDPGVMPELYRIATVFAEAMVTADVVEALYS